MRVGERVIRRPLFLVFLALMAWIVVWYRVVAPDSPGAVPDELVNAVGTVDEIQKKTSGTVLVLSDVEVIPANSKTSVFYDKILLYDSSRQKELFDYSRPGNMIEVAGTFSAFTRAANPGEFDEFLYYESRGMNGKLFVESLSVRDAHYDVISYTFFSLRQKAVQQLFDVMDEDDAGILCAMLLGEKAYLPEEEKELYQKTGIGHMLAISGLHISFLGAGLFFFLRKYVLPMRAAVLITVFFLFLYGEFTGFPVATTRAVLMMCCLLFARYTGRSYDSLSALSFSGILTLVEQPTQLFQCGFLLSYAAMAGILLFAPVLEKMDGAGGIKKAILSGVSVFATTMPVMLWFYYEICPYSVLANLVVLPVLSLLIGVGMAGCVLSFFWLSGSGFVLASVHYVLQFYEYVCRLVQALPGSVIVTGRPPLWFIILYYVVLFAAVWSYGRWERRVSVCAGVALFAILCFFAKRKVDFLYTQLSVGQGDCACIFSGGSTYLIDGGSSSQGAVGKNTIRNFLKYYGRTQIDRVFISHSDADHTNGIVELVEKQDAWGLRVGCILLPQLQEQDENYEKLVRIFAEHGTTVVTMKKGDYLTEGGLTISCLHPFPDYEWKSENDYSLTLQICYEDMRILSTGDLEESGESMLGELDGPYDLLKVGHHGSKTSTSADFLRRVSPLHAVISAGKKNRYGHPAPETIRKLEEQGVRIWSTIEKGAVFAEWEAGSKKVYGYIDDEE